VLGGDAEIAGDGHEAAAARAAPLIAAITGLATEISSRRIGMKHARAHSPPREVAAGAEGLVARGRQDRTRAAGSPSKRFQADKTPSRIAVFTTLRFSCRLSVMTADSPFIS